MAFAPLKSFINDLVYTVIKAMSVAGMFRKRFESQAAIGVIPMIALILTAFPIDSVNTRLTRYCDPGSDYSSLPSGNPHDAYIASSLFSFKSW